MNFTLERISDPAIEVVTLADAIRQVREFSSIQQDAQDELTRLITNAREWVEDETGQALIDQTWRLSIGHFAANPFANIDSDTVRGCYRGPWIHRRDGSIYLRRTPVLEITKFVSVASDGTETDIDAGAYQVRDAGSKYPRIVPLSGAWAHGPLKIEFRAGYADRTGSPTQDASVVPARFKQSILLHVEAMYDRDPVQMSILIEAACNNVARLVCHLPFA